ncbi:MAG: peptidase S41, partial [Pyrinomonadaceae bacterium]
MFKTFSLMALILSIFASLAAAQATTAYLTEPSISPDRREIAFVSSGDIWSVASEGGAARLLVSHPANESRPMFSPDGRYLAFASNRTGGGDIYILEINSGDLRRLTFDDVNEQLDAWSRDGKWIYFSSSSRDISGMNDIYRVAATGGTPMQVSADRYTTEFQSTPLADGSIIFAARGNSANQWWRKGRSHLDESELWQKTGDKYQQLTPRGAKQMWPMATADGSKLYFMSDRTGPQNIWMMPRGGQAKQITTFTDGRVLWPNLSFDGQEIVFERNFRIWKMKADGGKPQELAISLRGAASSPMNERTSLSAQVRNLALSPDGKKVAVIARGEVFAASAKEGGEAVRITNTVAPESYVAWSPDSKKLVYVSERDGSMSLFQYDFATETEIRLTSGPHMDASPKFSPNGKSIAFIRNGRAIFIYESDSKQQREVCKIFSDTAPLLGGDTLKWSPDGKWLAFLTQSPETRSYTNVSVVPAAGGTPRLISFLSNSNSGAIAWSPDGTYILFDSSQRTEDGVVARIDLKLRTPRFREDQFRDLFKQENPKEMRPSVPPPSADPQPTVSPSPTAPPEKKDESKVTEIDFADIRKRLSFINTNVDSNGAVISPDGKTLLVLATAEGQFNLYTITLD